MALSLGQLSTSVFVSKICSKVQINTPLRIGLQTQSNSNPTWNGPWDAIKKIHSAHGIKGLYKGQVVTFLREAAGYGVYFLAYEKLVQREMIQKGIRRDQISSAHTILYGAAAGYAVR